MTVEIFYKLSKEGQKDAVRKGVKPAKIQKIDVPDDACLDLIDLMSFSDDGRKAIFLGVESSDAADSRKYRITTVWSMHASPGWKTDVGRHDVPEAPDERDLPKAVGGKWASDKPRIIHNSPYPGIKLAPDWPIGGEDMLHDQNSVLERIREIKAANDHLVAAVKKADAEYKTIWDKALEKAHKDLERLEAEYEEDQKRIQKAEEEHERRMKEKREKARREMVAWIKKHGSSRLQKALEAGMLGQSKGIYHSERIRHDLGEEWLLEHALNHALGSDWRDDLQDLINPSEEVLDAYLEAKQNKLLSDVEAHFLPDEPPYRDSHVIILATHKPTEVRVGKII